MATYDSTKTSLLGTDNEAGTNPGTLVSGVGAVSGVSGVSVSEVPGGTGVNTTVITLSGVEQTVTNGTEYQSTKLYDFPEGNILILGVSGNVTQTTTSTLASTLNASSTGAISLGTAAASNVSLTSTMANVVPTTAFTSSATINVAGTAVDLASTAVAFANGMTTAADLYLNTGFATTTDVDGNATQEFDGTIVVKWILLGNA